MSKLATKQTMLWTLLHHNQLCPWWAITRFRQDATELCKILTYTISCKRVHNILRQRQQPASAILHWSMPGQLL
ncbi:hypothetical protein M378DRAFT_1006548 [Amanita muscaria Koide BX008]|uniref:Uncharacterized protein n=1 Tax=Amanita muscaria (strain Koide BX008) TaxID=946122 RepID=A0A0C2WT02_AMAMK|nr:hypothetical protein M378DRAFT_1006548 [Amanita muscaria Koide BX008]